MKFKLPLLLALSLMWQAASWGDEWTNIATAVTVTEGYLCAGELAADSTGTDILCDTSNPYIDSAGNVGISNTAPEASLHIKRAGADTLVLENINSGGTKWSISQGETAWFPDTLLIRDRTSGADSIKMVIKTNGNVGIGTTAPTTALDVSGTFKLADGGETCTVSNDAGMIKYTGGDIEYCDGSSWDVLGNGAGVSTLASLTDVDATSPATGSILRFDGASWTTVADLMTVMSTTTMAAGFPDYIRCGVSGTDQFRKLTFINATLASYEYRDTSQRVLFNISDGSFSSEDGGASDCNGKSIITLYADGQAFNFLGNNGAQTSLTELIDVSATIPAEGEVLSWNDSAGLWEPSATASAIDGLGDIGDVSETAAGDGQVLAWDNSNSEWAPKNAQEASVFSCPAGFTLIQNAGQTMGCMQTDEHGSASWSNAVDACYDSYGGRLPTTTEWYLAAENYSLSNEIDDWERVSDYSGVNGNNRHAFVGDGGITEFAYNEDSLVFAYRCFIPASGQISITTVAALSDVSAASPTDGQVLSWNNSAGLWEPSATASAIDALGDIGDVSETVATEGQVLSYNTTNNSWEPSSTALAALSCTDGQAISWDNSGSAWVCVNTPPETLSVMGSWTNVTGSRTCGTTYTNSSNSALQVVLNINSGGGGGVLATVDGVAFRIMSGYGGATNMTGSFLVPPGVDYAIGCAFFSSWHELEGIGGGGAGVSTLVSLTDVSATDATEGQMLSWDNSAGEWIATDAAIGTAIQDADGDTKITLENAGDTDTISFTTAGTERMVIDASGNVGIGTDALGPQKPLSVYGDISFGEDTASRTTDRYIGVGDAGLTGHWKAAIEVDAIGANGIQSDFAFLLKNGDLGGSPLEEHMRITSTGNVGIGTAAPSNLLHIEGSDATMRFYDSDTSVYSTIGTRNDGSLLLAADAGNSGSSEIVFINDGSEHMRIDSSGNVGIGTTAPAAKLHIEGNLMLAAYGNITPSNDTSGVTIFGRSTGYPNGGGIVYRGNTGGAGGTASDGLEFYANGSEKMRIDNSGNVGIGTAVIASKLHLYKNSGHVDFLIESAVADAANVSSISIKNPDTEWSLALQDGSGLRFREDSAGWPTRIFLKEGGNVGIGTASPSYKLHVNGTAYATGAAGSLSDRRHKLAIQPLENTATDLVMKLRPVTYKWRNPTDEGMEGTQYGFIAQEVEDILPTFVLTQDNEEKTKGLKYNDFLPLLTKALQEQTAKQDRQAVEIAKQAAEIKYLKEQILLLLTLKKSETLH